jgi:hypothetical protein
VHSSETRQPKPKTTVEITPIDRQVKRFNEINSTLASLVPAVAVATDTISRALPLLQEMQQLLSQRPRRGGPPMLCAAHRVIRAQPATCQEDLPSWGVWIGGYAASIGYSVRHLRRLILAEPPRKYRQKCGWTAKQHHRSQEGNWLLASLIRAIKAGTDTTALVADAEQLMNESRDLFEVSEPWEPTREEVPRHRGRKVTEAP